VEHRSFALQILLAGLIVLTMGNGCGDSGAPSEVTIEPRVLATSVLEVRHTDARVAASIQPSRGKTRYSCRYGQISGAESLACEGILNGVSVPVTVTATLNALSSETRYYFRWETLLPNGETVGLMDSLRTLPPNRRPETAFNLLPVDTLLTTVRVHAWWTGYDIDGTVVAFDVSASELGSETEWRRTTRRDSILALDFAAGVSGIPPGFGAGMADDV